MNISKSIPSDDEYQVLLADPNDPDDDGGYAYGEGEGEEWHKERCPCELCRVERLELMERVLASRPACEGEDCQGCPDCPPPIPGRPVAELTKTGNYLGFSQYVSTVEPKGEALPALLTRTDGATIFYAQKINSIYGESGMVKSWIALQTAITSLEKGGRVMWWDFEDRPDTLYRRAKQLDKAGVMTGENVAFIKDGSILELGDDDLPNFALECAVEWLVDGGIYSVVIIDAAESSGAPSDGASISEWNKEKIKPFASRDVGGLVLDHVPKQRMNRPRGAIGSTHKLTKIDGAAISISGRPWTKTEDGELVMRLGKDRHGDVPGNIGQKVAVVKGHYEGDILTITIEPPTDNEGDELDIALLLLEAIGGAGADGIKGVKNLYGKVKGKNLAKQEALSELLGDGLVVQTQDGKSKVLTITDAGKAMLDEGGE